MHLIVGHVPRCGAEFGKSLDDLGDGLQEILFCSQLAARANRVHACLCANATELGTGAVWAETGEKLVPEALVQICNKRCRRDNVLEHGE